MKYTLVNSMILYQDFIHGTVNSVIIVSSVGVNLLFLLMIDLSAVYYFVRLHGTVSVSRERVHGSVILIAVTVLCRVRVK